MRPGQTEENVIEEKIIEEELTVLGAGTMGHSIALSAAMAGVNVKVWCLDEQDIERGRQGIAAKLEVIVEHELIDAQDLPKIQSSIQLDTSWEDCVASATFIIEAIPENLVLKQDMFQQLDQYCVATVILASNTSGLSPTAIGNRTKYPERTVVTHFWNPAHLIPLVEIVRGKHTSEVTVERSMNMMLALNKKPIVLQKDIPGFIANRLQYALFREAQYILQQGVATFEDIDAAVQYSIGRRLSVTGPFLTADMGGLDVFDSISSYLFPELSTAEQSLESMRQLVDAGRYGQKNGAGFYPWSPAFSREMNAAREAELIHWLKKDSKQ